MTDDPAYLVAQIARALSSKAQCWYRPASIIGTGLVPTATGECAVWITCGHEGAITCYRFLYARVEPDPADAYPERLLRRQDCQIQEGDGQSSMPFWAVPGNVRDMAETMAGRWLGIKP
jgi:hypothetical protein